MSKPKQTAMILLFPKTPEGRTALRDDIEYMRRIGSQHPGAVAQSDWDDIALGNAEAFAELASYGSEVKQ